MFLSANDTQLQIASANEESCASQPEDNATAPVRLVSSSSCGADYHINNRDYDLDSTASYSSDEEEVEYVLPVKFSVSKISMNRSQPETAGDAFKRELLLDDMKNFEDMLNNYDCFDDDSDSESSKEDEDDFCFSY